LIASRSSSTRLRASESARSSPSCRSSWTSTRAVFLGMVKRGYRVPVTRTGGRRFLDLNAFDEPVEPLGVLAERPHLDGLAAVEVEDLGVAILEGRARVGSLPRDGDDRHD